MKNFSFDPDETPERNVELFFEYLKTSDAEMAEIFQKHLAQIHPLPDASTQRSSSRKKFSEKILVELKALQKKQETQA